MGVFLYEYDVGYDNSTKELKPMMWQKTWEHIKSYGVSKHLPGWLVT